VKHPEDMTREELEEEVAYLRSELGVSVDVERVDALRNAFGVMRCVAQMIFVLRAANGRMVPNVRLDEMLPGISRDPAYAKGYIKSLASHIRRSLGADAIRTAWGQGYALTPEGIAKVDAALSERRAV
jgi:DNA-binding response OmpR family regulator